MSDTPTEGTDQGTSAPPARDQVASGTGAVQGSDTQAQHRAGTAKEDDLERWLDKSYNDLCQDRAVCEWYAPGGGEPGCFYNPYVTNAADAAIWRYRLGMLEAKARVAHDESRCADWAMHALGLLIAAGQSPSVEPGRLQILMENLIGGDGGDDVAHAVSRAGMLRALRTGMLIRQGEFVVLPPGASTPATTTLSAYEKREILRGAWEKLIDEATDCADMLAGIIFHDDGSPGPYDLKRDGIELLEEADELAGHLPPPFDYDDFRDRVLAETAKELPAWPGQGELVHGEDGSWSREYRSCPERPTPPKTDFHRYLEQCADALRAWRASGAAVAGSLVAPAPAEGNKPAEKPTWESIRGQLLTMKQKGGKYTSGRDLGKALHCSEGLVKKVIGKCGELQEWRKAQKPLPTPKTNNKRPADELPQTDEADPADVAIERADAADRAAQWAKLIDAADADERAKLNQMTQAEKDHWIDEGLKQDADERRQRVRRQP